MMMEVLNTVSEKPKSFTPYQQHKTYNVPASEFSSSAGFAMAFVLDAVRSRLEPFFSRLSLRLF